MSGELFGKDPVIRKLSAMSRSGRMPHTVIFTGDKGVGKSICARYLAALYLCETANNSEVTLNNEISENSVTPCGVCPACKAVFSGNHPDVIYPEKTGKQMIFTRDTMRGLCADAYVKPSQADSKIYVLTDFDSTDMTSQNILLKVIEDPPGGVKFILTASTVGTILPTILSRAVAINVPTASEDATKKALEHIFKDDETISPAKIAEAASSFGGNIGDSVGFIMGGEQAELQARLVRIADSIAKMNEYEFLAAAFEPSETRESRERLTRVLRMLCLVLRDAVILTDGDNPKLIGSYAGGAGAIAKRLTKNRIMRIYALIEETAEKLMFNVNVSLSSSALAAEIFGTGN
jgi:DNA polymerase-3 subunit delta'